MLNWTTRATVVAFTSLVLFGCGGDPDANDTTPSSTSSKTTSKETESSSDKDLADLEKTFTKALDSGNCKKINSFNPSTRPSMSTKDRCETLQLFKDFKVTNSEDYGDGAVIDFYAESADLYVSAIFVRQTDDSLGLVLIDNLRAGETIGTNAAKEFDDAAAAAATALRNKDCGGLLDASYVRRGFAVGERDLVCERLEQFPVADLASRLPDEPPVLVGGNDTYAFYALGEGEPRVVLIMARQEPADDLFTTDFPKGGAEYGLLEAFPILDTKDDEKAE